MDIFTGLEGDLNTLTTEAMLCQSADDKPKLITALKQLISKANQNQESCIAADASLVEAILASDLPDWSLLPAKTPRRGGAL